MMSSFRNHAFSLVEMLVVLAILGALAAILFPVFARAREQSRRSVCKTNMHQIGLAVNLYRADYDGMDPQKGVRLTHGQLGLPYNSGGEITFTFFNPYIRNRAILYCPSSQKRDPEWGCSYGLYIDSSEETDPSQDWEGLAAMRGQDYPLAVCDAHNGPDLPEISYSQRKSNEVLYFHVLRIDGRVSVKMVRASQVNGGVKWW